MVERTEPIRQDLDSIRASMTDTLEQIETQVRDKVDATVTQAKRTFDIQHQVNERPWLMFGLAMTAGFALGSMAGDEPEHQPRPGEPMRYYTPQGSNGGDGQRADYYATSAHSSGYGESQRVDYYESPRRPPAPPRRGGQMAGALFQMAEPLRDELSMLASAAMRSAMHALQDSLSRSIPQFESEYRAVQRERGRGEDEDEGGEPASKGVNPAAQPAGQPAGGVGAESFRARPGD